VRQPVCVKMVTPSSPCGLEVNWTADWFLPLSAVNGLRRKALAELAALRERNRPSRKAARKAEQCTFPEQRLTPLGNVLIFRSEAFYIRRHGVTHIEPAAESGPRYAQQEGYDHQVLCQASAGWCQRDGGAPAHPEPLYLLDEEGRRYQLRFDCRRPVTWRSSSNRKCKPDAEECAPSGAVVQPGVPVVDRPADGHRAASFRLSLPETA